MNPNIVKAAKGTPNPVLRSQPQKAKIKRFNCGIVYNIVKNENEMLKVNQRIQACLRKNFKYDLLFFVLQKIHLNFSQLWKFYCNH